MEENISPENTPSGVGNRENDLSSLAETKPRQLNPEMVRNQENASRLKSHASFLSDENSYWFLLRDLRRANSLEHGYELLEKKGMRVFTPLEWKIKKIPTKI